jgi:hypothetical protein
MLPIRITFAGCSTRLVRSDSSESLESLESSPSGERRVEAGTEATGCPSGPTITTRCALSVSTARESSDCSGCSSVMPPP